MFSVGLMLLYNYFRFGSFSETGYSYQIMDGPLKEWRALGLMSIRHIPKNIYYSLMRVPYITMRNGMFVRPYLQADYLGMSLFLTAPYLFWLVKARLRDTCVQYTLIAAAMTFLFILMLFSTGGTHYGYRFALDFFPCIFVVFIYSIHKGWIQLTFFLKSVIIVSAAFNLWLASFIFYNIK
jgi:hypothetical protein